MSEKMPNAPVYYALAQAKFNPVAAMAKYVDDVQDRLRREGYTLFEPHQVTHVQFSASPGQPTEPQVIPTVSWLISKEDRTSGFILTASAIVFHTTHYETNETFIPELLRGLSAVNEVVGLAHVSRLGLRYLDAVLPMPGETVDQYLVKGLEGIHFGATQRYAMTESVFETTSGPLLSKGTLIARVYRANSALGYPPDMVPSGLIPMAKFAITDEVLHAVIDIDHFVEGPMPLDFDKLGEQASSLHATIKQAFEATRSEHAKAVWDRRD